MRFAEVPPPRGAREVRYLPVPMPERFALEFETDDGDWMLEATCASGAFDRLLDGSYLCSGASSVWIRCIADHGDHFEHVDGASRVHRYRLVPLDDAEDA